MTHEANISKADSKYDAVYSEGSNWVRMANAVTWRMAAIFLPISISCIGLSIKFPLYERFLAFASIYLFAVWVYMSIYYGNTATKVREVLIEIEKEWQIPENKGVYQKQGLLGKQLYGLRTLIITMIIAFMGGWAGLLYS